MDEHGFKPPVDTLLKLGSIDQPQKWLDTSEIGITRAQIPDLIRMLEEEYVLYGDETNNEVWAPTHAWRALGQLKAVEAIPALIHIFGSLMHLVRDSVDHGIESGDMRTMMGKPSTGKTTMETVLNNDVPVPYSVLPIRR